MEQRQQRKKRDTYTHEGRETEREEKTRLMARPLGKITSAHIYTQLLNKG